jgi:hypothetical protein
MLKFSTKVQLFSHFHKQPPTKKFGGNAIVAKRYALPSCRQFEI